MGAGAILTGRGNTIPGDFTKSTDCRGPFHFGRTADRLHNDVQTALIL